MTALLTKRNPYSLDGGIAVDANSTDWTSPAFNVNDPSPTPTSALHIGASGDLVVGFADNPDIRITLFSLRQGIIRIAITKIYAPADAALIVALY